MAPHFGVGDWRFIAEQTGNEMDPAKLMILVERLCCALEGERRQKSQLAATLPGMTPGLFSAIRRNTPLLRDRLWKAKASKSCSLASGRTLRGNQSAT